MTKWSTAISNTRLQDRNLREMSEKPLQNIMKSARSGDLDSLNYLLQQTSLDKIQTRSIKLCEQLFHLGKERKCEGLYCDGALSSCVEVAVEAIYGTSSDLSKEPKRAIAIQLRFDELHATAIKNNVALSVLGIWDDNLEPEDNHLCVWTAHMISAMNRDGWVTDCRRNGTKRERLSSA